MYAIVGAYDKWILLFEEVKKDIKYENATEE